MAFREPDCLKIDADREVKSVAFSPDGKTVAVSGSRSVSLCYSKTGRKVAEMNCPSKAYSLYPSVAFSPCCHGMRAKSVLAASFDDSIYLWGISNCKSNGRSESAGKLTDFPVNGRSESAGMAKLTGYPVRSIAFTVDGIKLVSGSDCSVQLWDLSTNGQLMQLNGHTLAVVSVATVGDKIVSGSADSTVRIWDMSTGTELLRMNDGHHSGTIWSVACSPEGGSNEKIVASGGGQNDKNIRLWDMMSGQHIAKLDGHTDFVNSVAFSPDGMTLVSASDDGTVRLWDLSTRRPVHILKRHSGSRCNWVNSVAFSSDGKRLVSGGFDGCRVWTL